ncbi:HCLS1-binding protein 3-like, partial [Argonauta hians]
ELAFVCYTRTMQAATITFRQLKNQETGLDVSIPNYEQSQGLLTKSVEYQVTIVTNLPIFKSPKHKESDVVQFVVGKKFNEFEELYSSLNDKYSGIALPAFPKKVLLTTDEVYKERRSILDKLMKFCCKTERLSKSFLFLQFLGAPPSKLQKMATLVIKDDTEGKSQTDSTHSVKSPTDEGDIFGAEEEESQEIFSDLEKTNNKKMDSSLFVASDSKSKSYKVKMFQEDQMEEDSSKTSLSTSVTDRDKAKTPDGKSNLFTEELLQVEDDLSKLLTVNKKPRKPVPTPRTHKPKKAAESKLFEQPSPILPTSVDEFAKYIEENTERDEADLFS